jgi:homoserine dehydrogenase
LKTNLISKSETTQLLKIVSEKWKINIPKVKNLKIYEIDNETQLITGNEIKILKIKNEYLPFLSEISTLEKFPYVQVDMGAVKLIASCEKELTVSPVEIKINDPLCVNGTLNAISFTSEHSGTHTIIGRGAGGIETASAILRDLIDIRKEIAKF